MAQVPKFETGGKSPSNIEEYNKTHPDKSQQIEIFQIKEKFGGLRIYLDNAPEYVKEKVRKAEELY